jgi:hypothetical protein
MISDEEEEVFKHWLQVKLAKDVLPPERRFPFDDFGFFVGVTF